MMQLTKRGLLAAAAAMPSVAILGGAARAQAIFAPKPAGWRRFELTTQITVAAPAGKAQAWIPLPSVSDPAWVTPLGDSWTADHARVRAVESGGARLLHVAWEDGLPAATVEVRSRFAGRDRAVSWDQPAAGRLSHADRRLYLAATPHAPLDGVVKATADRIVAGATGDRAKAAAIYEWVVDNTYRDPAVRGCGAGEVAAMLQSGHLGGKCVDINGLYVALARASGIPARKVYGVRVAPSAFGYHALGANSPVVTKAQHCRAEAYLEGYGWVAVDPADVRKVMLEEVPGGLGQDAPKVVAARRGLFGSWETNWLPYNRADDVALPGAAVGHVSFLMYPQVEIGGKMADCLAPDTVAYALHAREVS